MTERIYLSPPHLGIHERKLLDDAIDSNWIAPLGPHVESFERELAAVAGAPHATALSSGTAALHLALRILGVGSGDRVLCSSLTFIASAGAITYQDAIPVFVDSDRETWNLDPDLLDEELDLCAARGSLPAAVIAVDLYGQVADYERIEPACAKYGVPLIEDAAEALGASYRGQPAGSFGNCAAFSFNGNKIITTSGGGMLVSKDKAIIDQARFLATQARQDAPHYEHETVGYNYRMSNLLAAVGRGQLMVLKDRVEARRAIYERYHTALEDVPGLTFTAEAPQTKHSRWLTTITVDPDEFGASREELRLALEQSNIEARPVWKPMHLQPVFREARFVGSGIATELFESGLCLPSGSSLTPKDQERVVDVIRSLSGAG
jgi:pyridoxal phosphate-dependent aminotransferase EpsN